MATKYWTSTSSTSFSTAGNWSDTAAPTNGDTLIFNGTGTASVTTDLSSGLTGTTIIVEPANTCNIGTAATPLTLAGGTLRMPSTSGAGSPAGATLINIAFGSSAATVDIQTSNSSGSGYLPTVRLKGLDITAVVAGGNVGFAVAPGDTATVTSLNVMPLAGQSPRVLLGAGATVTSLVVADGAVISRSNQTHTTVRVAAGRYTVEGTGAHTTLHVDGGAVQYNGSGTITTANVRSSLDLSGNGNTITVTTANLYAGGSINADNGRPGGVVFTNAVNMPDGTSAATLRLPKGMKATIATI